jgi:SAM-dependent methyltransferase
MKSHSGVQQIRTCPNCGSTRFKVKYFEPPYKVVKCLACSLVYLGNPPEQESIYEDYYEGAAPRAEDYRIDSDVGHLAGLCAINEQRIAMVKRAKPAGKLLDVGCGRGYFLKTAQQHGFQVFGVDASERAVEYAKNAFGLNATVQKLDDLRDASTTFDLVTLWHVLEHFIDPFQALSRIRTLLAEGGICFMEVPNLRSIKFVFSKNKWEGGNHPLYHRTFFTGPTLRQAILKSGFSTVRRLKGSYRVPGKNAARWLLKRGLNAVAMDAFLNYKAWK